MTANPIDSVIVDNTPVPKADVRGWGKARVPQVIADADELRSTNLVGQLVVILKSNGRTYAIDTGDTTTVDNGSTCITSNDGFRFKRIAIDGLDGADGATWYSGSSAPSDGTGNDGDFYFRTATADVYKKVSGSWGSPVANLHGIDGADGIDGTSIMSRVRLVDVGGGNPTTAYAAGQTLDGKTIATNDLILRATPGGNASDGIYLAPASGAASRLTAFSSYDSMPGCFLSVMEGTTYADTLWRCTSDKGGTLGTTALVFSQFSSGALTDNSVIASKVAGSAIGDAIINGTLAISVAGNALTAALKTLAGTDPSNTDPVKVNFPNGSGGFTTVSVTAALSLTITSGSTLGTSNNVPFRIWFVLFNDAGTVRIGARNCASGNTIFPLTPWLPRSSTGEGGAGAADSAGVTYTGTAVTSKYSRILGFATWESGLATAGTWSAGPDSVIRFESGMPQPGDVVQVVPASTTTQTDTTSNSYVDTPLTAQITPRSAANLIAGTAVVWLGSDVASTYAYAVVRRGGAAVSLFKVIYSDAAHLRGCVECPFAERPGVTSSLTYVVSTKSGTSGNVVSLFQGDLEISEIMT